MGPGSTSTGGGRGQGDGPRPRDGGSSAGRCRWPLGFIGVLAIVAASEGFIATRHDLFGTLYSIMWRWTGQAVRREARAARVLCFGSSLTSMGVSPRVLEERLGMPAYNFATAGGQPYSTYTLLRQALGVGSDPAALVVDFTWSTLTTPYDWSERTLPELASLGECIELAVAARDPDFLARLVLLRSLPSFRCRAEVRSKLMAMFRPGDDRARFADICVRNANVNRGGLHAAPLGRLVPVEGEEASAYPTAWACLPISEQYIHKFLDLAESRDIPVFWLVPPIAPPAQSRRDELALEASYTRFIQGVVGRHRGVVVVDGRGSRYGAEAFVDLIHLNRDGAVAFTRDLAGVMAARIGRGKVEGSDWVHLPEYRPDPAAPRIEDLAHSAAAVNYLKSLGQLR